LETKCFTLNRSKTEYMKSDFSTPTQEEWGVRLRWLAGTQERHVSPLRIDAPEGQRYQ
jgi:hypothetical protein